GIHSDINLLQAKCREGSDADYELEQEGNTFMCLKWSFWTDTFDRAKNYCQFSGTRLGVFDTWDKMKILQRRTRPTWIGLDDIQIEGRFHWHDGQEFRDPEFSGFFHRYEPSDSELMEDCVILQGSLLNDVPCSASFLFVCEKVL
ncbi:collectin-12, partial [Biomphalaria pfeifferi]